MIRSVDLPVETGDGHRWELPGRVPEKPDAALLWLPALGVAARHYLPFADALAARGIAVFVHEWRGHGSSNRRAGRERSRDGQRHGQHRDHGDWGYAELLATDLPASQAALARAVPEGVATILGGHSLGGQLACCRLAMAPVSAQRLWLVASGAPYWRAFPAPHRYWLPLAYRFLPWLARHHGALPGRRIGFGGREAPGVMADWAQTGLSGRYRARGLDIDLESAMSQCSPATRAVTLADDWLAPASSLRFLLGKIPRARAQVTALDATALGARADHFAWLKQPQAVVETLTR